MKPNSASLTDAELIKEREYWLQKLSSKLVTTSIPLDFKRPAALGSKRETVPLLIDEQTQAGLRKVCESNEVLIFAVCVAALKVCLYKYTGVDDVIIGTAIHEHYRDLTPLNRILALRDRIHDQQTVKQLLEQVLRTITDAYDHQKYPFNRLLQHLEVETAPNRGPLFNVVALLENISRREDVSAVQNDATVMFALRGEQVTGVIEYSAELFKPETIGVFARHLATALREMMGQPDAKVSELQLLSAEKRRELVEEFNATDYDFGSEETVVQLFEAQVARTPDAVAVVFEGHTLTYRELHERANQLAHALRSIEAGPGTLIGVYLEHSLETMIGLLGVLKAGAAYVPLDPDHPLSRTAFMLSNADISIVLTQEALVERIRNQVSVTICLDSDWSSLISPESVETLAPQAKPVESAYVIYTSGSTGGPKGVVIPHAALANYISWAKEIYLRGDDLDFPLYSSLAFDLTVTSLYVPLISGRRVIVYRSKQNEFSLTEVLKDNQTGVLKLTPSHAALVKDKDNSESRIKRIIVGGEAFEANLAVQIWNSFGRDVEIYNEYGPTEATVGCMVHLFNPDLDTRAVVPIGKPIANTKIFLLDEAHNPLAENMAGEIYISGAGLSSGYLNHQQTSERFIDNPILPGRKMYKTGDIARWLPEGILQYVGRNDEQIKFHGHRLELNEIRSLLNQHPQIKDNLVVLLQDNNGNDVLVAFYISDHQFDTGTLRTFLGQHLLEETIPNHFMKLVELPLTSNGKIDRSRLPTLEEVRQEGKPIFVAARTPTEKFIAATWAELLGIPEVGIHDNFFELGGHSLLAYQVISRLGGAYQLEIPMRSIFDAPTVGSLALFLTQMQMAQENTQDLKKMIEEIKMMSGDELENTLAAKGI